MAEHNHGADITPNETAKENTETKNSITGTDRKTTGTGKDNNNKSGIDYKAIVCDGIEVNENELSGREKSNVVGCKNLIPFSERTEEEQKEMRSKAGKASGVTRRRKKDMREVARAILEHDMTDEQIEEVLGSAKSLLDGDKSTMAVLTARMIQEAGKGNYKAYETVRDTAGFKPKDQVETTVDIMTDADRALIGKIASRLEKHG